MLEHALRKTGDLTAPMRELGLWMVRDAGQRLRARRDVRDVAHEGSDPATRHIGNSRVVLCVLGPVATSNATDFIANTLASLLAGPG